MSRYRYAKANGQQLESNFINPAAAATTQVFRADQSYNLTKDFNSGSTAAANSYVSAEKIVGYSSKDNLTAWWRLIPGFGLSITDNSGNERTMTPASGSSSVHRPGNSVGNATPSSFIQSDSLYFNRDGSNISQLDMAAPDLEFSDNDGECSR